MFCWRFQNRVPGEGRRGGAGAWEDKVRMEGAKTDRNDEALKASCVCSLWFRGQLG